MDRLPPFSSAQSSPYETKSGSNGLIEAIQFKIEGYIGQKLIIEGLSNRQYVPSGKANDPMERVEKKRITLERPTETLRIVITKLR